MANEIKSHEKEEPLLQADPGTSDVAGNTRRGRRSFLGWLLGIGTATVGALLVIPILRFSFYPLWDKTTEITWSDLGSIEELGTIKAPQKRSVIVNQLDGWRKVVSEKLVYVVHDSSGQLKVISPVCPHLGCSIHWSDESNKFGCPCHNGSFSPVGVYLSGPPPRDMDQLESRIVDGHLQVHYQLFRQLIATKEIIA